MLIPTCQRGKVGTQRSDQKAGGGGAVVAVTIIVVDSFDDHVGVDHAFFSVLPAAVPIILLTIETEAAAPLCHQVELAREIGEAHVSPALPAARCAEIISHPTVKPPAKNAAASSKNSVIGWTVMADTFLRLKVAPDQRARICLPMLIRKTDSALPL